MSAKQTVDFLVRNSSRFGAGTDGALASLTSLQRIINATVDEEAFSPYGMASLLGVDSGQA